MAISSKIEEILLEITKNAGNISDAYQLGIGDIETPRSAIFEINNLLNTAQTGYPYFGIVETDPLSFRPSYSFTNDRYNVTLSSGTISYNNSIISVSQQKIPIKKEFLKNYYLTGAGSTAYKYGITIGFPLSEAQNSTLTFNSNVSTAAATGDTIIKITNSGTAVSLGFPLEAHVGSLYVRFSGITTDNTGLFIDPNYYIGSGYGTVPSAIPADTFVKFVYQPRLKYITGFPVQTVSEDPEAFDYYPPLPSSWLPVAKILVKSPDNPLVAGVGNSAWVRTAVDMPTSTSTNLILGDSNDVSDVVSACSNAIKNLNAYKNDVALSSLINAVTSYSLSLANISNYSINKYWSLQPFRPTQYYSKGLSFSGLERFEFPENFVKAYYNVTRTDLQHTFGVFRGDLVSYNVPTIGTAGISTTGMSLNIIGCSSDRSSLYPGTQIYGATAVRAINGTDYVETVPTYKSVISTNTTANSFMTEVVFTGVGITDALFYHVYKRPNNSTETYEKRLSLVDDIIYPSYNSLVPVTDTTALNLAKFNAFKITAAENCHIGGVSVKLGFSSAYGTAASGDTSLSFAIYGDSSGNPNYNNRISNLALLPYNDLISGSQEYTIRFNSGINVTSGISYWLVINKPSTFTASLGSTEINLRISSSGSGKMSYMNTDFDGINTWTGISGEGYVKVRGFLDDGSVIGETVKKGIKLTNRISNIPRRLSVYVPPVDDIVDNTGLIFNGSGVAIVSTTDKTIKNQLIVSVTAKLGETGLEKTLTATVPQGTARDTRFLLGETTDLFDRVTNIAVNPGSNVTRVNNGPILWNIYDLITVETEP